MSKSESTHQKGVSISLLVRLIRRTDEYEEWKRAVFLRDRFTCQVCGRRNGRRRIIEAHHVVSLSSLVRQCGVTTVDQARECGVLWSISNGQTLCRCCHEQTESYPKQLIGVIRKRKAKPCQQR